MKVQDLREKGIQYSLRNLVKDIWHHAGKKRKYLVMGTIFRGTADLAGLYPAYALGVVVTSLTNNTFGLHKLFLLLTFAGIAYIIRPVGQYYAKKLIYYTGQAIYLDIEKHMVNVLISKDSAWHEKESSGVKINMRGK